MTKLKFNGKEYSSGSIFCIINTEQSIDYTEAELYIKDEKFYFLQNVYSGSEARSRKEIDKSKYKKSWTFRELGGDLYSEGIIILGDQDLMNELEKANSESYFNKLVPNLIKQVKSSPRNLNMLPEFVKITGLSGAYSPFPSCCGATILNNFVVEKEKVLTTQDLKTANNILNKNFTSQLYCILNRNQMDNYIGETLTALGFTPIKESLTVNKNSKNEIQMFIRIAE